MENDAAFQEHYQKILERLAYLNDYGSMAMRILYEHDPCVNCKTVGGSHSHACAVPMVVKGLAKRIRHTGPATKPKGSDKFLCIKGRCLPCEILGKEMAPASELDRALAEAHDSTMG